MKALTEEEAKIVEENHNLIYWYASIAHLNLADWYDLLAIELCYTVQKYDSSKGSLGNYFKLRADGLVYKEYRKEHAQKRLSDNIQYIDNIDYDQFTHLSGNDVVGYTNDADDNMDFEDWITGEHGKIIKMKYEGYSQTEIANVLGVSQSHVSKILKKLRENYNENNGRNNS